MGASKKGTFLSKKGGHAEILNYFRKQPRSAWRVTVSEVLLMLYQRDSTIMHKIL